MILFVKIINFGIKAVNKYLSSVPKLGGDRPLHSGINVGRVKHDKWSISTQL